MDRNRPQPHELLRFGGLLLAISSIVCWPLFAGGLGGSDIGWSVGLLLAAGVATRIVGAAPLVGAETHPLARRPRT